MPLYPSTWNNSAHNPRQIFVKTYIGIFNKICQENSSVVKTDENNMDLTGRPMYT